MSDLYTTLIEFFEGTGVVVGKPLDPAEHEGAVALATPDAQIGISIKFADPALEIPVFDVVDLAKANTESALRIEYEYTQAIPPKAPMPLQHPLMNPPMQRFNAHDILSRSSNEMVDRGKTYDSPDGERSMVSTVNAFNAITGHGITEEQGWKFMACLKLARSEQGDFRLDSFVDGAAYLALAGECANVIAATGDKKAP